MRGPLGHFQGSREPKMAHPKDLERPHHRLDIGPPGAVLFHALGGSPPRGMGPRRPGASLGPRRGPGKGRMMGSAPKGLKGTVV